MTLASLPNAICWLRIALTVPVVWALVSGLYSLTLALFLVAAVSDGLDGFLAKRFGWESELGKLLDPVADKLLLVSVFITLTLTSLVPLWLALAAVVRDVVIGVGAATYRRLFGALEGRPTVPSKLNTLLQLSFVLAVVARAADWPVPDALVVALGAATFITTVVSGIDYVLIYSRRAARVARERRAAA